MFGLKLRSKHSLAYPGDARLKTALRQWPAIEPRSDFESCVWRRIRTAACPSSARAAAESTVPGLWVIVRGWLSVEPAWVHAVAAAAGLVIGVSMALSVPQTRASPYPAAPLIHAQTLTGAYLTMVSGGAQ